MVAYTIHNLGSFMSKLLSTDCFDSFLLEEAVIRMAVTYSIDGRLNKDFYENAVWENPAQRPFAYQPWSEARVMCREMIKGKKAPASFRFTLQLKPEYMEKTLTSIAGRGGADYELQPGTLDAVGALAVNIRLEGGVLRLITGVSMKQFVMDKSPDHIWDEVMGKFLSSKGVQFDKEETK